MALNTEFPAWLQQQYAPSQQSPWILQAMQQGMERYQMQQKLPLQIQEMGLQNIQMGLANDTQRMANEARRIELDNFAGDQELLDSSVKQAASTPGGAMTMTTPSFRSSHAMNLWLDRVKADSDTAAGIAYKQRIIEQTKRANAVMGIPGTPLLLPRPDGTYDEAQLQQAEQIATTHLESQKLEEIKTREMHDPVIFRAERLRSLSEELRNSQRQTLEPDEGNPQYWKELSRQADIQAEMTALQAPDVAHAPAELVVETHNGVTGLRNTKSGAWHVLDKGMTEKEFFDKHLSVVLQNTKPDKAPEMMRKLYDEYQKLGGRSEGAAPAKPAISPKFNVGKIYVDKNGNRAIYQADGTWKQVP